MCDCMFDSNVDLVFHLEGRLLDSADIEYTMRSIYPLAANDWLLAILKCTRA
jgi:hypothetical protein